MLHIGWSVMLPTDFRKSNVKIVLIFLAWSYFDLYNLISINTLLFQFILIHFQYTSCVASPVCSFCERVAQWCRLHHDFWMQTLWKFTWVCIEKEFTVKITEKYVTNSILYTFKFHHFMAKCRVILWFEGRLATLSTLPHQHSLQSNGARCSLVLAAARC